jgi:hypothetical protein
MTGLTELRRELGLADLVLMQVVFVVGSALSIVPASVPSDG